MDTKSIQRHSKAAHSSCLFEFKFRFDPRLYTLHPSGSSKSLSVCTYTPKTSSITDEPSPVFATTMTTGTMAERTRTKTRTKRQRLSTTRTMPTDNENDADRQRKRCRPTTETTPTDNENDADRQRKRRQPTTETTPTNRRTTRTTPTNNETKRKRHRPTTKTTPTAVCRHGPAREASRTGRKRWFLLSTINNSCALRRSVRTMFSDCSLREQRTSSRCHDKPCEQTVMIHAFLTHGFREVPHDLTAVLEQTDRQS